MVQENSLQATGAPRAAYAAGQAGVAWRSIGRRPTAISLKNTGAVFFRAVARDRHATPVCPAAFRTVQGDERAF
jgi:hypothetical protein